MTKNEIWYRIFARCLESADSLKFSVIFTEIICGLPISRLAFKLGVITILKYMKGCFIYKLNNENNINNTNFSQGKWSCFASIAQERKL